MHTILEIHSWGEWPINYKNVFRNIKFYYFPCHLFFYFEDRRHFIDLIKENVLITGDTLNPSKNVLGLHNCSLSHCVSKFAITRVHCDVELLRNSRYKNKTIISLWRNSFAEVVTQRCSHAEVSLNSSLPLPSTT